MPDPEWPVPPPGWQFWVATEDSTSLPTGVYDASAGYGAHESDLLPTVSGSQAARRVPMVAGGAAALLVLVGLVSGGFGRGGQPDPSTAPVARATSSWSAPTTDNPTTETPPRFVAAATPTASTKPRVTAQPAPSSRSSAKPAAKPSPKPSPKPAAKPRLQPSLKPAPKPVAKASSNPAPTPSQQKSSYRLGVNPGSFCSPGGAFGHTKKGTLMQCKTSATDSRNRWRKA